MSIKKAVIPVAGHGTRLLPATKSQPKEMLPVGRKPVVQYVVEELEAAGLDQLLFVTGSKKRSIEDHFDKDVELLEHLHKSGRKNLIEEMKYQELNVSFYYVRQSVQRGLADAIGLARGLVDQDSFVVALGDSIVSGSRAGALINRMLEAHAKNDAACTIAVEKVPPEEAFRYGIVEVGDEHSPGVFPIKSVVEKPNVEEAPSDLAIAARYVFSPAIFDAIDRTMPDKGGELQLTDSIGLLLRQGLPVYAVPLNEKESRYDIGNYESYFKAFVDFALADEKYGHTLRHYLTRKL
ncbi:MAG: UTP--glucose-1-phosphate uridylyltransferase [Candidatus Glassbacteria bacterium]|nr:UTP--glucose-1-phosphate uridylyltransferase [Candidatus Glassbacteria bacterium]